MIHFELIFVTVVKGSVQLLSHVRLCNTMDCSTPGFCVHHQLQSLLKLMSIESVMPSNHLILCQPLLWPSVFASIRVFSSESVLCIRWPKYWSFSFNISPSNEYSELIFFRIDWLDLRAVQGTLKRLLQHHKMIKTIPKKNKCIKAKWSSEKALQIAEKRSEVKGKGEKER